MKLSSSLRYLFLLVASFFTNSMVSVAQDSLQKPKQIIAANSDFATTSFLYENGRINLVVYVLAIIFVGIILYLVRIERKLSKLEKNNS